MDNRIVFCLLNLLLLYTTDRLAGVWVLPSLYVFDLAQAGKLYTIRWQSLVRDETYCRGAREERKPSGGCDPRGESMYGFLRGLTGAVAGCIYIS